MHTKQLVGDVVAVILVLACLLLASVSVLQYLHFGTRGLAEDMENMAGMDPRRAVDNIYIQDSDLERLQEAYSPAREKLWIASVNKSNVLTGLELTGVGNRTHVSGEYDSSREPEVLIHSHRPKATARLSDFDKEWLLNESREVLNRGEEREDLYWMSCILHRKWRFTEPRLYCYTNPIIYRDTSASQISKTGLLNRVDVTALD